MRPHMNTTSTEEPRTAPLDAQATARADTEDPLEEGMADHQVVDTEDPQVVDMEDRPEESMAEDMAVLKVDTGDLLQVDLPITMAIALKGHHLSAMMVPHLAKAMEEGTNKDRLKATTTNRVEVSR